MKKMAFLSIVVLGALALSFRANTQTKPDLSSLLADGRYTLMNRDAGSGYAPTTFLLDKETGRLWMLVQANQVTFLRPCPYRAADGSLSYTPSAADTTPEPQTLPTGRRGSTAIIRGGPGATPELERSQPMVTPTNPGATN
jgi:hypothetical protein